MLRHWPLPTLFTSTTIDLRAVPVSAPVPPPLRRPLGASVVLISPLNPPPIQGFHLDKEYPVPTPSVVVVLQPGVATSLLTTLPTCRDKPSEDTPALLLMVNGFLLVFSLIVSPELYAVSTVQNRKAD